MRLDKFLTSAGVCTRSEASRAARGGKITVNGIVEKDPSRHIDPERDDVTFFSQNVAYRKFVYVMLNKPQGYVSATEDARGDHVVTELLDAPLQKRGLFPCGRLDRDTTGLMILTDNGQAAHRKLAPKHHAEKEYRFRTCKPVSDIEKLEAGVRLDGGYVTLPCKIVMEADDTGVITLTEGKYHQIKRMFEAVGNKIVQLERISFAGIRLDPDLPRGAWRYLTEEEIACMEQGLTDAQK